MLAAPTVEQLVAFRQRQGYFSYGRHARRNAARLATQLRTRASTAAASDPAACQEAVRQTWVDATIEPVHQANPIFPAAREP